MARKQLSKTRRTLPVIDSFLPVTRVEVHPSFFLCLLQEPGSLIPLAIETPFTSE